MSTESRLEFEKSRGTWRIVATGWPALGFSFGLGLVIAVSLLKLVGHGFN